MNFGEHKPTNELRYKVKSLYSVGVSQEKIAKRLGFSVETLVKYYGKELEEALEDMNADLCNNVYQRAFESDKLAMYWLNKRAGWEKEVKDSSGAFVSLLEKLIPKQHA